MVRCHVGDYYVYQRIGRQESKPGFSITHTGLFTLTPGDVELTGTGAVRSPPGLATAPKPSPRGSGIYSDAVGFHADRAGVTGSGSRQ